MNTDHIKAFLDSFLQTVKHHFGEKVLRDVCDGSDDKQKVSPASDQQPSKVKKGEEKAVIIISTGKEIIIIIYFSKM